MPSGAPVVDMALAPVPSATAAGAGGAVRSGVVKRPLRRASSEPLLPVEEDP